VGPEPRRADDDLEGDDLEGDDLEGDDLEGDDLEEAIDEMDPDVEPAEEHREDLDVGLPPAGEDPMAGPAPSG